MMEQKRSPLGEIILPNQTFSSAVVFGAAHGIGSAIENELNAQGTQLLVSIDKDSSFSQQQVFNADKGGYRLSADITAQEQLRAAVTGIRRGSLDLAVFSAGVRKEEDPALTYAVNVEGTRNCFDIVAPLMKKGALMVFVSSDMITWQASRDDGPPSPYVESKREMARLAQEVAASRPDLRVLTLLPGPVETALFLEGKSAELLRQIEQEVGIFSPREFAQVLFHEILPQFSHQTSGAMVRVYKKEGFEWIQGVF